MFVEYIIPPQNVDHPIPTPVPAASTTLPSLTTVDQDAHSRSTSQTTSEKQSSIIPQGKHVVKKTVVSDNSEDGNPTRANIKQDLGKDYAKTVKNQSKPGNIGHKIGSLHQKPDQRAFFFNNQANEAKFEKIESSRSILAIYPKPKSKEKKRLKVQGLFLQISQSYAPGANPANAIPYTSAVHKHSLTSPTHPTCLGSPIPAVKIKKSHWTGCNRVDHEITQRIEEIGLYPLAPTEGYGEDIVISEILAENFEIKTNLLQDVPNDAIKLMLFSYSLEDRDRILYEKEPPNSILTWDDLVNKFVNQFFPPSKTTHLKNEISRFTQRFEEKFSEAWDRFTELLRACLHHGFSELTQIDTFYNGLTEQDQDSLNAASGGNLLNKTTRKALKIIENKSKVRYSRSKSNVSRVNTNSRDVVSKTDDRIDKLADQISNLVEIVNKQVIAPTKAVEKTCVTCGGAHAYYECIATDSNTSSVYATTGSYNQVPPPNRVSHQIPPHGFATVQNNSNRFNQNQGQGNYFNQANNFNQGNNFRGSNFQNSQGYRAQMNNVLNFQNQGSFFQNQPSTSGTLPSNIVPDLKGEMKAVTTRSGLAYEGPSIPTESPLEKVDKQNTKEILDKEHSNNSGSTAQVQPPVVPISILEPDVPRTQTKPTIPFADALLLMPKFALTIKSLLANKDKLFELAKVPLNENCSAMLLKNLSERLGDPGKFLIPCNFLGMNVCHALADLGASINLMPLSIWKKLLLPELTPTRMTLELADSRSKSSSNLREVLLENRSCFNRCIWIGNYPQEVVQDKPKSSNPTLVSESDFCEDPIVKTSPFGESDFFSKEIENCLKDDSIPIEIENYVFDPEGDILFIEKLLNEDPFQLPPINLNQVKSPMKEPEYSFSMGYEHFSTTLVTELDEVAESSAKNLVPIPREYEVTSDDESEYNELIKDDSFLAFTTFTNLLFNDKDDFIIHDENVPIKESKVYSNPLFDDDEIYSDELESHFLNVESNFVESLSNHDTSNLMERLITINPCPRPMMNAKTIIDSLPSSLIPVQDNDSQREEINIVSGTNELLPLSFENDDLKEEIYVVEELRVDNSISNSENDLADFNQDDPLFPRHPPEPPDAEFDLEPDSEEVISVVMNTIDEDDPGEEFDIFANDEDDDFFPSIFVI
nr:hypothetical protein [Tanacetum cinerariifolium]